MRTSFQCVFVAWVDRAVCFLFCFFFLLFFLHEKTLRKRQDIELLQTIDGVYPQSRYLEQSPKRENYGVDAKLLMRFR